MTFSKKFSWVFKIHRDRRSTGGRKWKNDFFSKNQKNIFFFKRYDKTDFTNDFFRLFVTFMHLQGCIQITLFGFSKELQKEVKHKLQYGCTLLSKHLWSCFECDFGYEIRKKLIFRSVYLVYISERARPFVITVTSLQGWP